MIFYAKIYIVPFRVFSTLYPFYLLLYELIVPDHCIRPHQITVNGVQTRCTGHGHNGGGSHGKFRKNICEILKFYFYKNSWLTFYNYLLQVSSEDAINMAIELALKGLLVSFIV